MGQPYTSMSSADQLAMLFKALTGLDVQVSIGQPHVSVNGIVLPPPPDGDIRSLDFRIDNPAYIGQMLHLAAHYLSPPHSDIVSLPETQQGWAWEIEDAYAIKDYLQTFPHHRAFFEAQGKIPEPTEPRDGLVQYAEKMFALHGARPQAAHTLLTERPEKLAHDWTPHGALQNNEDEEGKPHEQTEGEETPQENLDSEAQAHKDSGRGKENEDERGEGDRGEEETDETDAPEFESLRPIRPSLTLEQKRDRNIANQARRIAKETFPRETSAFKQRPPTQADRQLAARLTQTLRRARWKAPLVSSAPSKTPPGRLSSRAALTQEAQRALGLPQSAEPFWQTRRTPQENPPPIIGLMCDTSGSMKDSRLPMSRLAWALARATHRVQGSFAAVTVSRDIRALVHPGRQPQSVPLLAISGAEQNLDKAALALIGALNLDKAHGVRVLIISSDGDWAPLERRRFNALLAYLKKNGVFVLWLCYEPERQHLYQNYDYGQVVILDNLERAPQHIGEAIGRLVKNG